MHDLTILYRDSEQREQTRQHAVPDLLPATIDGVVTLYEGLTSIVLVRVSHRGETLYQAERG